VTTADSRSVLFIVHKEYPLHETRVRRQAEAVAGAGWRTTVLSLGSPGLAASETLNRVHVIRTPVTRRHQWTYRGLLAEYGSFWVYSLRHCLANRYDRVVVANPPDFLVFAALPVRLRGGRVILDVHDLMSDLFAMRMGGHCAGALAVRLVERASMLCADRLMTVHEPYARLIARRAGGKPVHVVLNSADDRLFRPRQPGPLPPVFVFHGSLFERNGVLELVEAFAQVRARFPEAQLWLWGDGDGRGAVAERIGRLDLADSVTLSDGMRPSEEVAAMLRRAGYCVVPNRPIPHNQNALSCKALEAAAVGLAIVSGDLPVMQQYFPPGTAVYFRAGDVDDMARAMQECLEHPEEMERRAQETHEYYLQSLAWEQQVPVLLEALE